MKASTSHSSRPPVSSPAPAADNSALVTCDTADIIRMVKSKSEAGFNLLYDRYCGALYGILIKFVGRADVADDLLQEVFVKIWKHIDRFDPSRGTLFTWMLNIARNRAIDYLRSSPCRKQVLQAGKNPDVFETDIPGSAASCAGTIECKDIRNKVLRLDPKYAEVIDLVFFYGCTHEQTARIMNLPLGTVKARARKGLEMLKVMYRQ